MAHILGLVVAIAVAAALVAVTFYGCFMIVLTVLGAARRQRVDSVGEDLDAFLTGLLGPRDPTPPPDTTYARPGGGGVHERPDGRPYPDSRRR